MPDREQNPVLTVMLAVNDTNDTHKQIVARGVSEDVTVFENATFASLTEAFEYLFKQYHNRYRVILNLPPNVQGK